MTNNHRKLWNKWAKIWDLTLSFIGYDVLFREQAVERLNLNRGDTVLDLACGTGLNFEYLERKIGKKGKIVALDFSPEMLKKAGDKIKEHGWHNIELLERDASHFRLNEKVDAVLCTWAMVSIPDYEKALENSIDALKVGGKCVVLDFQLMSGLKGRILNPAYKLIFEATLQDITRKPWKKMRRYLSDVKKQNISGWLASYYICTGVKKSKSGYS
ncbi:MAG: class I SAM-dependent methyltransferase [Candidatus Heimdallarchaeota archaeon]